MIQTGKNLALLGVILQLGLLLPIGVAIGVCGTLNVLVVTTDYAMLTGHILAFVGFILILIALNAMRYRAGWLYASLWPICILWVFSQGVWTIFGVIMTVYLITNTREFLAGPKP
jgi:hypothetical protein